MRRFAFFTLTLFLLMLHCAVSTAAPLVATPLADTSTPPKIIIAPHRALYSMSLASAKNGGSTTDVSGHMLFEWADVCDGWAIQQHMQLHFIYAEGGEQDITSTELTWEAKDGKKFTFNIHHLTDGKDSGFFRGKAVMNADGSATATYTQPEAKTVTLPQGTMFPSAHTTLILQQAAQNEKLFSRRVFDGADSDGSSDISAFILPARALATQTGLSDKLKISPLLAGSAYPVRMAFYKPESEAASPDYEMDLDLLPNGVARHMKIDYGDFAVAGTLEDIELLASPSCP